MRLHSAIKTAHRNMETEHIMTKQPKPKPDDPEQSKRFEEAARELGVDKSGKLFKRAIERLARPAEPAPKKSER